MFKVSYKQIEPAFRRAYRASKINLTQDVDWQMKDFGYLYGCRVHTTLDAGGDTCLDYLEFATPEEVTAFLLKWS